MAGYYLRNQQRIRSAADDVQLLMQLVEKILLVLVCSSTRRSAMENAHFPDAIGKRTSAGIGYLPCIAAIVIGSTWLSL
jgi:hypothetical protein